MATGMGLKIHILLTFIGCETEASQTWRFSQYFLWMPLKPYVLHGILCRGFAAPEGTWPPARG